MPEESVQEKTEQATPRRRQDARKKGKVARSMELNSFGILFIGIIVLFFAAPMLVSQVEMVMQTTLQSAAQMDLNINRMPELFATFAGRLLLMLLPVFIAMITVGLLINFAQVGFTISGESLQPKPERINVVSGFKRLFSLQSLVNLFKNILKLVVVGWIAYLAIKSESKHFVEMLDGDVWLVIGFIGRAAFNIVFKIALAMMVLALLDYAYQRWEFEKSIRMTKQEIKEEVKQYEGSPLTRSRVRRVQQELSRMRMTREIPNADAVVTNPVHLAVALKYDPDNMGAPTVVAKGARLVAEKIKKIAREHGVPIVENPPVARALYQAVEVGGEIPANLYKAVAEVLAYVYRLKSQGSPHESMAE